MISCGIDWGSSTFRAYRFNERCDVIDSVSTSDGIRNLSSDDEQFEQVLFEKVGAWLNKDDVVLLSGMITSRAGWKETPYLECPVDVRTLANHAVEHRMRGVKLRFLPGLKQVMPAADVMRGEELQLLGSMGEHEKVTAILPGTHSKWASLEGPVLNGFRTIMTGELFELVRHQSLVGAIASSINIEQNDFLSGVSEGFKTDSIVADMFALRSAVLLEKLNSDEVHAKLSGMLIGHEIREGLSLMGSVKKVMLVGNDTLCTLYELAFNHLGIDVARANDIAAVSGFRQIALKYAQQRVNS